MSLASALRGLLPLLLVGASLVQAQALDDSDLATRVNHYWVNFTINPDGSFVEEREYSVRVLQERALDDAKNASVSYSTSIQKAEVKAAYTLKADGRRIDAPKTNYQVETSKGREANAPVFSDRSSLSVVFPDVAVGDSVVFAYRVTASQPMFDHQFSTDQVFWRSQVNDDVRITIDAPTSLWAQFEARQMQEVRNEVKNGRHLLEWHYSNPHRVKNKRQNYSVMDTDREPGFAFSTFHNYGEIAAAYAVGARPKAVANERVRKLADEIVPQPLPPRETARALYEWVATHLTYAGNCVGLGAVVPHDLDFILDNRMGDCKDHASLLQALLAAKDIGATQALINAGSLYRLPKIPVATTVNHVITYIPSLDLYADATSDSTPFGMLPTGDEDKPVLRMDGGKDGDRTPVPAVGVNRQIQHTTVKVQPDGSIQGDTEVTMHGTFAVYARAAFRDMSKEHEDDLLKNYFKSQGYIGSGELHRDDAKPLLDDYSYRASFNVADVLHMHGPGAFSVEPVVLSMFPIGNFLGIAVADVDADQDVTCMGGSSIEEYVYELPKKMKILATPDDFSTESGMQRYSATYKFKGNKLTVRREFDDRTPTRVCTAEVMQSQKAFAKKVLQDTKSQVVYK